MGRRRRYVLGAERNQPYPRVGIRVSFRDTSYRSNTLSSSLFLRCAFLPRANFTCGASRRKGHASRVYVIRCRKRTTTRSRSFVSRKGEAVARINSIANVARRISSFVGALACDKQHPLSRKLRLYKESSRGIK